MSKVLGKLEPPLQIASTEGASSKTKSRILYIRDKDSNLLFLIDTGSEVSIIPPRPGERVKPIPAYSAANGTIINKYGTRNLTIDLGLKQKYSWIFIVGDVKKPIIGADFLEHFNISINLHNRSITDAFTNESVTTNFISCENIPTSITQIIPADDEYTSLIREFPELTNPNQRQPQSHQTKHFIVTTGPPVFSRPRPLPPDKLRIAKAEFKAMVDQGICIPSDSPYASPLHMVQKSNGEWRPCGDYRRLNETTLPDRYPIPRLRDFTNNLHNCTHFSKIDLQSAYHQVQMDENSVPKTAVTTPFGLFAFLRMPFGLRNASQTFQRMMNEIFSDLDFIFVYIDDLLIASHSHEEHLLHIRIILERLAKHGILINPTKSEFGKSQIEYLGHKVTSTGISPLPSKVEAIANFPRPTTQNQLRRYLGVLNFYHRFVPQIAKTLAPLNSLIKPKRRGTKVNTQVDWNDAAEAAFNKSKQDISQATELQYPAEDAIISLAVDASDEAIGAVLQQTTESSTTPLSFFSKKLAPAQTKYSAFGKELCAMYESVKHFRYMLEGKQFIIFTDHAALTHAIHMANDRHSPRESRHLSFIAQFTTDIRHISGRNNIVADMLSRPTGISHITQTEDIETLDTQTLIEEQFKDNELEFFMSKENSNLNLQNVQGIICDLNHNKVRPFVPGSLRQAVFSAFHNMAHPGINRTIKLVSERYVWPEMRTHLREMTRCCHHCQQSKVFKHNKAALQPSKFSGGKLDSVNIDIIGPLPPSQNYRYALVMVDRYTRWIEAAPLTDITSKTVARSFMLNWISRYGTPTHLTSDRGAQFTSMLWKNLMEMFGITLTQTTSYHPQSNGLVERCNRDIKTALIAQNNPTHWVDNLPLVLLALKAQYKEDLRCTSAEMMFGQTLRLPGELLDPPKATHLPDPQNYVQSLRNYLSTKTYTPPRIPNNNTDKLDKDLNTCTHVYVRIDAVKPSLTRPYLGPFKIIKRSKKYFTLNLNGKVDSVSIDRLKAAILPINTPALPKTTHKTPKSSIIKCNPVERPIPVFVPQHNLALELPFRFTELPPNDLPSTSTDQTRIRTSILPFPSEIPTNNPSASHNKKVTFGDNQIRSFTNNEQKQTQLPITTTEQNIQSDPVRPTLRTRSGRLVKKPKRLT